MMYTFFSKVFDQRSLLVGLWVGVVGLSAGALTVYAAWQDPTAAPTGGNPDAPLNVGVSPQVKAGDLGVNGVFTGYLGVLAKSFPANDTTPDINSFFQLTNRGTGGTDYTWRIYTAAVGGGSGVNANSFEVWEYPGTFVAPATCCRARFKILKSPSNVQPGEVIINGEATLQINKGGALQYTGSQQPTLSLAERTDVEGKMSWIQFHNSGQHEAFIRLGKEPGGRRFEFGDSQGGGAGLWLLDGGQLRIYEDAANGSKYGSLQFSSPNGNFHIDSNAGQATYINWWGGTGGVNIGNGASGYGTARAAAFSQQSTRASKEHIAPSSYGLDDILALNPVRYVYRNDPAAVPQIGLIAEDTVGVIPEVVTRDQNGVIDGIDYGKLTVGLIGAVKDLNAKVDVLEKRVETLERAILVSPNGSCFAVSVGDDGSLSTAKTDCPSQ